MRLIILRVYIYTQWRSYIGEKKRTKYIYLYFCGEDGLEYLNARGETATLRLAGISKGDFRGDYLERHYIYLYVHRARPRLAPGHFYNSDG